MDYLAAKMYYICRRLYEKRIQESTRKGIGKNREKEGSGCYVYGEESGIDRGVEPDIFVYLEGDKVAGRGCTP